MTVRRLVAVLVALSLGLFALATAGCGGGGSNSDETTATEASSSSPKPSDPAAPFRADVAAYNGGQWRGTVSLYSDYAQLGCAVGSSADFPGTTLITVIVSTGSWWQFSYTDGREGLPRNGDDYTTALPTDWPTFKASSGVDCSIAPDGTITIE